MANTIDYRIACNVEATRVIDRILAQSSAENASDVIAGFHNFTRRYRLDVAHQAAAFVGGEPVAGCLLIVNPGASGNVFLPEKFDDLPTEFDHDTVAEKLLRLVVDNLDAWDLGFVHSMQRPDDITRKHIFEAAGFTTLNELVLMESPVPKLVKGETTGEQIEWVAFDDTLAKRFADAVLATYENSLDCPELSGLRTGLEILEGHRWSGVFEQAGWHLLRYDNRDAGVVLLNRTEEAADRLELIYMGLAAWARGKGLGKELLRQMMRTAQQLRMKNVRLAVDSNNRPAMNLYRLFGFMPTSRQVIMAVLNEARRRRLKNGGMGS